MPVFTVGHESSYDYGISTLGDEFKKLGRCENYSGGFACRTADDARRLIEEQGKGREWAATATRIYPPAEPAASVPAKLRCIFCDFTGDSLAELRVHSSECKKHPLMIVCNAYQRDIEKCTAACVSAGLGDERSPEAAVSVLAHERDSLAAENARKDAELAQWKLNADHRDKMEQIDKAEIASLRQQLAAAQGSTEAAKPSPATIAGPMTGEQLWKTLESLAGFPNADWNGIDDDGHPYVSRSEKAAWNALAAHIWPASQPAGSGTV